MLIDLADSYSTYDAKADLWHVACALFLSPNPTDITFLTLDKPQRDVARRLGFAV